MTTKSATAKHKNATAKPAAAGKKLKKANKANDNKTGEKTRVIRDSFTMPQNDYAKIGKLKQACLQAGIHVKKSELLRAGLHALGKLSVPQLKQAIAGMEQIKTGRPLKKAKA